MNKTVSISKSFIWRLKSAMITHRFLSGICQLVSNWLTKSSTFIVILWTNQNSVTFAAQIHAELHVKINLFTRERRTISEGSSRVNLKSELRGHCNEILSAFEQCLNLPPKTSQFTAGLAATISFAGFKMEPAISIWGNFLNPRFF